MITVRFVDHWHDIPAGLWDACFQPPREGLWWYRTLEECGLDDQFTFFYGLVEQTAADGSRQPVGIAPCFVADVPLELVVPRELMFLFTLPGKLFPSLLYQRTLFVGSPCSDEGWVGLLPSVGRLSALLAVHDAVAAEGRRRRIAMLVWKDLPDSERPLVRELARQRDLFVLPGYPNALVRFSSGDREDYFNSLKGSRRHQLKKKLRLSAQRVQVTTEAIQNPPPAVLDEIFSLFQQTFEQSETKFERLNRRFFELLAKEEATHFLLLREQASGAPVAFMMCLVTGDLVINKFIGFDYSRPREWLLYFRLWEAALDWSLARGASGIQSGQTCYAPKIEQGHSLMPLFTCGRHSGWLMQRIYRLVARGISWQTLDEDLARYLKAHPEEGEAALLHPDKP